MDLRILRYFLATYETGSVSAASRRCFVAQPSISAAVAQLEDELGAPLFERHSKGVRPTGAGQRLYPLAARLIADSEAIVSSFSHSGRPQPLRLGLMRSLGAERMSNWLKRLMERIDNLELTLVNPEEASDARIVTAGMRQPHETFEPIWNDRYRLALPSGHPLSLKERVVLSDLEGQPFILRAHCEASEALRQALIRQDVMIAPRAHLRTIEYSLALVAAGVGLALVPDWPDTRRRLDMVLRPLADFQSDIRIGVAYPKELNSKLQEALKEVCEQVRNTKELH
jgi:DNA-binding transcriptional LysR family regulator